MLNSSRASSLRGAATSSTPVTRSTRHSRTRTSRLPCFIKSSTNASRSCSVESNGGEAYHYIPCLNGNPAWITGLAEIAEQHLVGWPTILTPAQQATRKRDARIGRNPRTGAAVDVDAKLVPYFKPGKEMRERLNLSEVTAE